MKFEQLFQSATGHTPFPYQRAFAERELFPDVLEAPTGAGKTAAAILTWLWRRRYGAEAVRRATPRRLVFCLPMRSLVSQTTQAARTWLAALNLADEVGVHALLGGAVDNSFDEEPEADVILIGTQDQLLSRALNRGYALSRYRWPVHYALLNNDCLWVMDEVQLMGVGLSTSAQLAALRRSWCSIGPSHSLWMSATMDCRLLKTVDQVEHFSHHRLSAEDHAHPELAKRLSAPKVLTLYSDLDPADETSYARGLAQIVRAQHVEGTRTLVVVNRVRRAQALHATLQGGGVPVTLLHSRFRPPERRAIERNALRADWSGVLVATQAIEAGVDITSKTLFTELAPWSSLVQRFGRCNRQGEWSERDPARIFVIDLPAPTPGPTEKATANTEAGYRSLALPYPPAALDHARALVLQHGDARPLDLDRGLSEDVEPGGPVIRRRDVYELFDTTPDLSGRDLDISQYVRDLGHPDVQIAWRHWPEGEAPNPTAPALHRDELCRVPLSTAADFVKKARKSDPTSCVRWDALEGRWVPAPAPLVPGVTYLLRTTAGGYDTVGGWTGNKKTRAAPIAHPALPQDNDADDRLTYASSTYVSLERHSLEAREAARHLRSALPYSLPWEDLIEAAHWHDLGKTHEAFQTMLTSALPEDDPLRANGPWAKSDGRRGGRRCARPHFRHELASGLAMIEHGTSDLAAYLAACHHGKVRVAIRSRPTERGPGDGRLFALGVFDGDTLPETSLGDGTVVASTVLGLDLMELGANPRISWTARALALLETWGPFRLALMETLVRVADWRASALHSAGTVLAVEPRDA